MPDEWSVMCCCSQTELRLVKDEPVSLDSFLVLALEMFPG